MKGWHAMIMNISIAALLKYTIMIISFQ